MGFLRLFLALSVVTAHVGSADILGVPTLLSLSAVNLFYMISGFYMALILNEKYADAPLRLFYGNRALRIYPLYFLSVLLILLIYASDPGPGYLDARYGHLSFDRVTYIGIAISNALIIGLDSFYPLCTAPSGTSVCGNAPLLTLNPPAWTISCELIFYLIAPFLLRSRKGVLLFLIAGMVYACGIRALPFLDQGEYRLVYGYYFFPASFLFFALGACGYHFVLPYVKGARPVIAIREWLLLAALLFGGLAGVVAYTPYYLMLLAFIAIPALFWVSRNYRFDRWLGDLSYPVYILHFPVLEILLRLMLREAIDGASFKNWALGVSLFIAALVVFIIEKPIERYRHGRLQQFNTPAKQ